MRNNPDFSGWHAQYEAEHSIFRILVSKTLLLSVLPDNNFYGVLLGRTHSLAFVVDISINFWSVASGSSRDSQPSLLGLCFAHFLWVQSALIAPSCAPFNLNRKKAQIWRWSPACGGPHGTPYYGRLSHLPAVLRGKLLRLHFTFAAFPWAYLK